MTFTKRQLRAFRKALLAKQTEIEESLIRLKKSLDFGDDVDSFDEETDETEEYTNYLGVEKVLQRRLQRIEKALLRIKNSTYGVCEACHNEISLKLLKENPDSLLCIDCKKSARES